MNNYYSYYFLKPQNSFLEFSMYYKLFMYYRRQNYNMYLIL